MSNLNPVLIFDSVNERVYLQSAWDMAKERIQEIVDSYNALGFEALQPSEFSRLFNDLECLVFDKITGGSLQISGIQVCKSKALDIIEKPAGYFNLIAQIEQLKKDSVNTFVVNQHRAAFTVDTIATMFILDESGAVAFSSKLINTIAAMGKMYVRTDKQIAMWNFAQAALEKFYELGLDGYFGHYMHNNQVNPMTEILNRVMIGIDKANKTIIPHPSLQSA